MPLISEVRSHTLRTAVTDLLFFYICRMCINIAAIVYFCKGDSESEECQPVSEEVQLSLEVDEYAPIGADLDPPGWSQAPQAGKGKSKKKGNSSKGKSKNIALLVPPSSKGTTSPLVAIEPY